jgi:hypothetical protein
VSTRIAETEVLFVLALPPETEVLFVLALPTETFEQALLQSAPCPVLLG